MSESLPAAERPSTSDWDWDWDCDDASNTGTEMLTLRWPTQMQLAIENTVVLFDPHQVPDGTPTGFAVVLTSDKQIGTFNRAGPPASPARPPTCRQERRREPAAADPHQPAGLPAGSRRGLGISVIVKSLIDAAGNLGAGICMFDDACTAAGSEKPATRSASWPGRPSRR